MSQDTNAKIKSDGRSTRHEARRQEVLEQAVTYLMAEGLSSVSVRPMAEALGISHRTLLHHFGSKDQMIATVLEEVQRREVELGRERAQKFSTDPIGMLDASWEQISSPSYLGFLRLSLEAAGTVVSPGGSLDMAEGTRQELKTLARAIKAQGVPARRAEQLATAARGGISGLNLDLMVTGDRDRVRRGYRALRDMLQREIASARKP